MRHSAKLLTFIACMFASIANAEESIVERLQNTGVRIRFARVDDNGVIKTPTSIGIPYGWKWTDQSVLLLREMLSTLDTPPTIYIPGQRAPGHEKVDELKNDFPNLSVKRMFATFLGITSADKSAPCRVHGLISDSPAESAGLRKGDTIVGVNEIAIANFEMLRKGIQKFLPDEMVEIHVKRNLEDLKINVTLTAFPLTRNNGDEPRIAPE